MDSIRQKQEDFAQNNVAEADLNEVFSSGEDEFCDRFSDYCSTDSEDEKESSPKVRFFTL
jgi:hypothetical protein